jgi:hypothetical protein
MSRPKEKPAEFFVDRSLGKSIVEGLRDAGLTIYSMADIYGEERAQLLADEFGCETPVRMTGSSSPRTTRSAAAPPSATPSPRRPFASSV